MRDPDSPDSTQPILEGPQQTLRPAVEPNDKLAQVEPDYQREGTYTTEVPTGARRPHAPAPGDAPQVTRDPSLSRAVDAEAAGIDPQTLGFGERDPEIGHPGPLAPDAAEQSPVAEDEPAGNWGSSGSGGG